MDNFNKYLDGENITLDEALEKDYENFNQAIREKVFDFFEHYDENMEKFLEKLEQLPNNPDPFREFVNTKEIGVGDRK